MRERFDINILRLVAIILVAALITPVMMSGMGLIEADFYPYSENSQNEESSNENETEDEEPTDELEDFIRRVEQKSGRMVAKVDNPYFFSSQFYGSSKKEVVTPPPDFERSLS